MPLSLLSILALLQFGCSSDEPEDACELFSPEQCSTDVQATACCSDEDNCYYLYKGDKYSYDSDGMEELIAVMCPNVSKESTAMIQEQMASQTKRLLKAVRINSVCQ